MTRWQDTHSPLTARHTLSLSDTLLGLTAPWRRTVHKDPLFGGVWPRNFTNVITTFSPTPPPLFTQVVTRTMFHYENIQTDRRQNIKHQEMFSIRREIDFGLQELGFQAENTRFSRGGGQNHRLTPRHAPRSFLTAF